MFGGRSRSVARKESGSGLIMAVAMLVAAFFLAGSGRDDVISLLIWRPVSALLLIIIVALYGGEAWRQGRALILFSLGVFALVAFHLVPLPPSIWTALPGRDIIAGVYRDAGMALPWQPLSIAQTRTWNALFSLCAPIAMLIVALPLGRLDHRVLLRVLIALGFLSGIIGMIQAIGPANGLLYFYRITNNGLSVGLFANRNHQAIMLATLYPLLAANISLLRGRPDRLFFYRAVSFAGGCLLVPLILMTGSRAGLVAAVIGMAAAWWIYIPPVAEGRVVGIRADHRSRLVGLGMGIMMLLVIFAVATTTPALERLLSTDPASELRFKTLPTVAAATWHFFPWGSGFGTFVETYQIFEPDAFVSSSYFNHAHNEFAELVMTGGLPAVALLIWAMALGIIFLVSLFRNGRRKPDEPGFSAQVMGKAGISVLAMLALGSITDYPLRIPSLMLYAVIAVVWCAGAYRFSQK